MNFIDKKLLALRFQLLMEAKTAMKGIHGGGNGGFRIGREGGNNETLAEKSPKEAGLFNSDLMLDLGYVRYL